MSAGWSAASRSITKEGPRNDRAPNHGRGVCHVLGPAGAAVRPGTPKNMRYALCAFPLIGGGHRGACGASAGRCRCPSTRSGPAASASFRCWVTGGIHLDGYADTCRRPFQLWRPGKEAGNFKRPPLRGLCRHPALHLLPRVFLRCVLPCRFSPRVGLCWTLALVLERGALGPGHRLLPAGQEHRPCPHVRFCGRPRRPFAASCWYWRACCCAALVLLGGGALVLAAALLVFWRYRVVSDQAVRRHHRRSGRMVFAES